MNPTNHCRPPADDELFDLLVDGELTLAQQRELLARLDETPGGWRRCALAFLEARSWRQSLSELSVCSDAVCSDPIHRVLAGVSPERPRRSEGPHECGHYERPRVHYTRLLAMAASFLVAFVLGWLLRETWRAGRQVGVEPGQVAVDKAPAPPAPVSPVTRPPERAPAEELAGDEAVEATGDDGVHYVALPVSGPDGAAGSVRFPVIERDSVDAAWLEGLPPAVPPDLIKEFLQTGHEVRQQRRLLPLRMRDGRSLVVPYDQVEIRYVGGSAYQ